MVKIRIAAVLLALLLSGCAYSTSLFLVNGASQPIEVRVAERGGTRSASQRIAPMAGWPSQTPENGEGWDVQISVGPCVLTYLIPSTHAGYPYSVEVARRSARQASYIRLRFGEDQRIALLAPTSEGQADLLRADDLEILGFPLAPIQRSCT